MKQYFSYLIQIYNYFWKFPRREQFFNAEELGLWVMMKNKIIYGEIEIQDCDPQENISSEPEGRTEVAERMIYI